jgi:hypothetical protein
MSCETTLREQSSSAVSPAIALQAIEIQAAIEHVRDDSQSAPEEYLEESVVPHGGE